MPLNIPMPGSYGESFNRGIESGSNLMNRLMQQKQAQQQLAQQQALLPFQMAEYEHKAQMHPLDLQFKQAQINSELAKPNEYEFKKERQPLDLELLRQKIEHEKAKTQKSKISSAGSSEDRKRQLTTPWANMTTTQRENMAALANGLRIRPDAFTKGMLEGKTFEQIGAENGYSPQDIESVMPKYFATASNVTQQNQREQNLAELEVMEDTITDWMAPYARKFAGMSPKQIADSFGGKNIDSLAKYYAALSLQPEMAALRIKVMGGNMSHAGLEEIVKLALGKGKISEAMVGPEVYKKMQHYTQELLKKGAEASRQSIYGRPGGKKEPSQENESEKRKKPVSEMTLDEINAELEGGE